MRIGELLRLVLLNINQNKFKTIMTSIGIVVGSATIVMVMAIGRGGQLEIAEQFAQLNAGEINISYEYAGEEESGGGGFSFGGLGGFIGNLFGGGMPSFAPGQSGDTSGKSGRGAAGSRGTDRESQSADGSGFGGAPAEFSGQMPGGMGFPGGTSGDSSGQMSGGMSFPGGSSSGFSGQMPGGMDFSGGMPEDLPGDFPGGIGQGEEDGPTLEERTETEGQDGQSTQTEKNLVGDRLNQEMLQLSMEDVEDIERFVSGITGVTLSYSSRASVEGGKLLSAESYPIAGVQENLKTVGRLELASGSFITNEDVDNKNRVCVLGSEAAKEIFGSVDEAVESSLYLDDRSYTVIGVLASSNSVSAGINPNSTIFIPYDTGVKYITGTQIDPVITVIAEDVNTLAGVIANVKTVLRENYPKASFTFQDSGSKMQAAQASNKTLTMLLSAMALIVFFVGGIGIMNVLFVSVKERTNEIGILKALGTPRGSILTEFLIESAAISLMGGSIGVVISLAVTPIVNYYGVRAEASWLAYLAALSFSILTGTLFGIYPSWKASRLEPVEALTAE